MATIGAWRRYRRAASRLLVGFAALLTIVTVGRTCVLSSRQVDPVAGPTLPNVEPQAAERLAAALRFRTLSATLDDAATQQAFAGLGVWLEETFPRVHAELELERFDDHARLYRWEGRDASLPPILLMAHLDVVPVEPGTEKQWEHPPFAGTVADGFVWGRGAIDDKASAVAIMEAVERLLADGFVPRRTIYLAFGHDEEVGGERGAAQMAAALDERGLELGFVLDEGGVLVDAATSGTDGDVALVGVAEKGYATAELTVDVGDGGHSSMPPPQTAVGVISEAIARIEQSPMPAAVRAPTDAMLRTLAPHMQSWVRRYALSNLWLLEPALIAVMEADPAANASLRTTHATTIVSGGTAENVLPTRAKATINFRIAPGDTVDDVRTHLADLTADLGVEVRITDGARDPTPVSEHDSDAFETLASTIRQRDPDIVVTPFLTIAGTDARHYQRVCDSVYRYLPVRFQADDRTRVHGTNERIAIAEYVEAIRFYMALMTNA